MLSSSLFLFWFNLIFIGTCYDSAILISFCLVVVFVYAWCVCFVTTNFGIFVCVTDMHPCFLFPSCIPILLFYSPTFWPYYEDATSWRLCRGRPFRFCGTIEDYSLKSSFSSWRHHMKSRGRFWLVSKLVVGYSAYVWDVCIWCIRDTEGSWVRRYEKTGELPICQAVVVLCLNLTLMFFGVSRKWTTKKYLGTLLLRRLLG